MDDFSPKKLADALIEKHDRLISEYSDEIEKMRQVTMLREKRDQLLNWVDEKDTKSKYSMELVETDKELEGLLGSFEEKNPSFYKEIESQISAHKEAKKYWLDKNNELRT